MPLNHLNSKKETVAVSDNSYEQPYVYMKGAGERDQNHIDLLSQHFEQYHPDSDYTYGSVVQPTVHDVYENSEDLLRRLVGKKRYWPGMLYDISQDWWSMMSAVDDLPENERRVIWLHTIQALEVEDIAARMEVAKPAVQDWLKRGRKLLSDQFPELNRMPGPGHDEKRRSLEAMETAGHRHGVLTLRRIGNPKPIGAMCNTPNDMRVTVFGASPASKVLFLLNRMGFAGWRYGLFRFAPDSVKGNPGGTIPQLTKPVPCKGKVEQLDENKRAISGETAWVEIDGDGDFLMRREPKGPVLLAMPTGQNAEDFRNNVIGTAVHLLHEAGVLTMEK